MKLIPLGDLIAIALSSPPPTTSAGIHYTPRENPVYGKGVVVGIGRGEVTTKGWVYPIEFKIGDCVLYDKRDGFSMISGNVMINAKHIVAIVDESAEIE